METSKKVNSLVLLRGIAVLAVCFCHFSLPLSKNNNLSGTFNLFHDYGKYGFLMFFVISGFIIPLSMDRAKYTIKYYFNFLYKRAIRLHPPYLIALALTLLIVVLTSKFKHTPFPESYASIIESCFYLNKPVDNPVFWSLQIEAEFYLFIGLFFSALKNFPKITLLIGIPLIMLLTQTPIINYINLFIYIIPFLIGTVGYMIYNKSEGESYRFELMCLIAIITFSFIFYSLPASLTLLFTILFILLYTGKGNKFLDFFGKISYSIYLLHFPVGVKLINLVYTHLNPSYYIFLFLMTIILVSVISMVFWKFIENPFGELSNKIKYGESKRLPTSLNFNILIKSQPN